MQTKLIMLPQPILVSDEEITKEDKCISLTTFRIYTAGITPETKWETEKKIIAGIEGLPKLDLSAIAEEIGLVDVEKLALDSLPITPFHDGDRLRSHDIYADEREGFIQGFKAAQSLNEKKYSEDDLEKAMSRTSLYTLQMGANSIYKFTEIIQSLSKPKEYLVEVQMEEYGTVAKNFKDLNFRPKITNNTIKVTKIL